MSYTTVEQVRHHLQPSIPVRDRVNDQQVKLSGNAAITFYSGAIESGSVKVKSIQASSPSRITITLTAGSNVITSQPIQRDSVVVASNSSLSTIYVENDDYIIHYDAGLLDIKSGGGLSAGSTVTIWFQPFTLYVENTDYLLNNNVGTITRRESGNIADGESVLLDYTPQFSVYSDDLLTNAVTQANGLIEKWVDPDGTFGADPLLQQAATYRAVAIICRTSAVRELSSRGDDRTASAWMKLADHYSDRSDGFLKSFRPAVDGPTAPIMT